MAHRPPPFAALRALEAACRHRSYTAAAAELNVTHSAVSQAVRRLEEEVGTKLFHRRGSSMEPAAASLALARAYAEASQSVGRALRNISDSTPNSLTVRTSARVARLWLTPLLPELARRFPDIDLCLRTEAAGERAIDLTIEADGFRPGHDAAILAGSALAAYASPSLLRLYQLNTPDDLFSAPLLLEQGGADWAAWFAAAGLTADTALRGLRFDDNAGLALDAAVRGLGVVLSDALSARGAVERGELIPVCAHISTPGSDLWATWQSDHPKARTIAPLVAWLASQTATADAAAPANLAVAAPQPMLLTA